MEKRSYLWPLDVKVRWKQVISHSRVAQSLCSKARLSAKSLIWKLFSQKRFCTKTHKWLINSVNGMHFGGHQSMCLFVSELHTQINKNNNGFEHFRKWPLNLRSWKTGKVHGKSHGTWKAQTNINPCEINTEKGDSVPKKIPWCYSKQQRPMSDSFARKRPINECIYTWIWLLLKEKQFFRLTPCILNRTASKPKVCCSWCKQHFFPKR